MYKIKCMCGCDAALYITKADKDTIYIGSDEKGKANFKNFAGVWVDAEKVRRLVKDVLED